VSVCDRMRSPSPPGAQTDRPGDAGPVSAGDPRSGSWRLGLTGRLPQNDSQSIPRPTSASGLHRVIVSLSRIWVRCRADERLRAPPFRIDNIPMRIAHLAGEYASEQPFQREEPFTASQMATCCCGPTPSCARWRPGASENDPLAGSASTQITASPPKVDSCTSSRSRFSGLWRNGCAPREKRAPIPNFPTRKTRSYESAPGIGLGMGWE
jgi:hypothetical protein